MFANCCTWLNNFKRYSLLTLSGHHGNIHPHIWSSHFFFFFPLDIFFIYTSNAIPKALSPTWTCLPDTLTHFAGAAPVAVARLALGHFVRFSSRFFWGMHPSPPLLFLKDRNTLEMRLAIGFLVNWFVQFIWTSRFYRNRFLLHHSLFFCFFFFSLDWSQ